MFKYKRILIKIQIKRQSFIVIKAQYLKQKEQEQEHNLFSLLQNKGLNYFCSKKLSQKTSRQNLEKDLQIITNEKLYQDSLKLTTFLINQSNSNSLSQKIQFYKKIVNLLRLKDVWKNHLYPYFMLIGYLFKQNQQNPLIQNYVQQVDQLLKLYQKDQKNKKIINFIYKVMGAYYLKKNNQQKGSFYLGKAYPNNQVLQFDQFSQLLLAVKMDSKKLQQAQKIVDSLINLLMKSTTFNTAFSNMLLIKWRLKKRFLQNQTFFIEESQQNDYFKKSFQICQNLIDQNNKFMEKWQELINNKLNNYYSKKNRQQKLTSEDNSFYIFRLEMANGLFMATRFLMGLHFRKCQYEKIIEMYQANKQKYSILYLFSELGKIYLTVSKCYKIKKQFKKALDLANQAKYIFSANPVQVTSDLLLDCYLDIIQLSNQLGQQQVRKINPQQMGQNLSVLSKDSNTFYYEYMLRKQLCYLYLTRLQNVNFQKETQKLQNRFKQFRKLLSPYRNSQILIRINYFKSICLFSKNQYSTCMQSIIQAENLIKQNKFEQPQLLSKLDNFKKTVQNYLPNFKINENYLKEIRRKNLQHFKNSFAYSNFTQENQISLTKSQFEIQCKRIQDAVKYALNQAIKNIKPQEKTFIFQVLNKIFDQTQNLFKMAKLRKINKIVLKGGQIKLQYLRLTYLHLLNSQNLDQQGMKSLIDRVKIVLNELNNIIEDCYDQNRKKNWIKLKEDFQSAKQVYVKQKMVMHQIKNRQKNI